MKTVLETIWDGLEARDLTALLIGGYALPAFGVARQTVDVDCLIIDSDSEAFHAILTDAGYSEELRSTCERYGPEGIYGNLERHL